MVEGGPLPVQFNSVNSLIHPEPLIPPPEGPAHRPCQFGLRFSRNAFGPSCASSLFRTGSNTW